jgi:hypothetical protein
LHVVGGNINRISPLQNLKKTGNGRRSHYLSSSSDILPLAEQLYKGPGRPLMVYASETLGPAPV